MAEHVDVLIVGAGLSGIGAAAQLSRQHPTRSYAVLEARAVSGGTWDLFRYPGVRSDSDMFTLGYAFKPWASERAVAAGPVILDYLRETAREYAVDEHIRYGVRVTAASWDSGSACWTVTATTGADEVTMTARFLWLCTGYYDYDAGHSPAFPGVERFRGRLVHPQFWPPDLDHTGRWVVVIGSGATAVTLAPALADSGAGHVVMLQRSPTYILSIPAVDTMIGRVTRLLGEQRGHALWRRKNAAVTSAFYRLSRARPRLVRRLIRAANRRALPPGYDVDTHFNPRYDPWDQRLCLVPDGDFFAAIRRGDLEVATDTIETFTETGLRLASGRELAADVVVTATGLTLRLMGGMVLVVDEEKVELPRTMAYRGLMLSDVPNLVFTTGYTNASWTLKADLVADFCCRLLRHMDERGHRTVVPVRDPHVAELPIMDLTSGYVRRALDDLPTQGDREPWRLRQHYARDARTLRSADLDDGTLRYSA